MFERTPQITINALSWVIVVLIPIPFFWGLATHNYWVAATAVVFVLFTNRLTDWIEYKFDERLHQKYNPDEWAEYYKRIE